MGRHVNIPTFLLAVTLCSAPVIQTYAQGQKTPAKTVTVSGTVVDEDGLPAVAASVTADGQRGLGVATDASGTFSIIVPAGSVVRISYIGYSDITRKVTDNVREWLISLQPDENFLEDAVVVGYGVQRKESVVGAISSVSSMQLNNTGSQNLSSALSGKVSGLLMTTETGAPGLDETTMILRGVSSFSSTSNSPLVIVDGVERSMSDLNPDEVQSISVLKDASATAVFGSKGANGVILVTTKTGSEGRAKMHAKVEYGVKSPLYLPMHVSSLETLEMANIAYKNDQSFASLYPDSVLEQYRTGSNPWRYTDNDWYRLILKKFAPSYDASFDISGGNKKVKYYAMVSYDHTGSLVRQLNTKGPVNFQADRINYRVNLDAALTGTTSLRVRLGGSTRINNKPTATTPGGIFNSMYMSTGALYPAYWPSDIYDLYPDPNYPEASGIRLSGNQGQVYSNPYNFLLYSQWQQTTTYRILSDLTLKQDLGFITKGLSAKAMVSLTTSYSRYSQEGDQSERRWTINWDRYDLGDSNIWDSSGTNTTGVYVLPPLSVTQETIARSVAFLYHIEGSLDYARKFGNHDVSATAVYNQRQLNDGVASPSRNQSIVGRVTYNYKKKYLFEANLGITGSEQFAPEYRYGFFPSVAAGYTISRERFWKKAMPWWSTMKLRFSWGLVGSDTGTAGFLYYSAYSLVNYSNYGKHYREGEAANDSARWETADKKDLGIEMGFFKDNLTISVDLFDEYRYDMLMTPVTTPLVGVAFKEVNAGALKKHGIDIDINWKKSYRSGWFYSVGALVGLNENRIVKYADLPYAPAYKKYAGTPTLSQRIGSTLIDDKYFQNINQIHGYPAYTSSWTNFIPGEYKFLDYKPEGVISDEDLHVINGSSYPPCSYSLNFSVGYKGLTFKMVGVGTVGKYIQFKRGYIIPFLSGDLKVHAAQLDYWSPTNRDAAAPVLTFNDSMYGWAGGTSTYPGYDLAIEGYTWRHSDYFNISEMYLGYKFNGKMLQKRFGIDALMVALVCNNLYMFTGLIEGNPQMHNTATSYYPLVRSTNIKIDVNF